MFETTNLIRDEFSVAALISSYLTYDLGRIPLTLGHVGLIGLLFKASPLAATMRTLSAVGQMALTNYLTQSLICMSLRILNSLSRNTASNDSSGRPHLSLRVLSSVTRLA